MIVSRNRLALLACVLCQTHGFYPTSLTSTKDFKLNSGRRRTTIPTQKEREYALSNDRILAEPMEPQDDKTRNNFEQENPFEQESEASPLIQEPLIPDINIMDQQTEILFESFTTNKPEDVLFLDVSEQINSIFSEEQKGQETESVNEVVPLGENVLSGTDYADFSNTNNTNINEDVLAVLEASEAAVVEAEASLSPDLIEQLDFTSSGSNSSTMSTPLVVDEIPDILSASSVVGEAVTKTTIESPSVSKILKFAIPAIGVWLCGPLLSLIDTSAVGLFSGTVQQAALNPAVAVTDYAALLIAFMYTGTTNLVAVAQESDRTTADKAVTTKTLIGAMQLSTFVGASLGAFLFAFARPLLKAIIGNDAISPAVFGAAMKYVRIRALGMPAAAIIGSTQAACLGMQDIKSPLYVLAAAAVVNFFGDVFFVGNSHALIGGAAGAAWATVFSQYFGVAMFVRWLCSRPQNKPAVMNLSGAILEMTGTPESEGHDRRHDLKKSLEEFRLRTHIPKPKIPIVLRKIVDKMKVSSSKAQSMKEQVTVRGFLHDKFTAKDLLQPPSAATRKQFAPYLVPVTTTQVGRVSGYVAMSHVVASSLGTISMAAQQVIVSLFYCLTPIADSLSLTAQSFLPSISGREVSKERSQALKKTARNFIKAGGVFGGAMMAAVSAIPLFTGFFTSDPAVVSVVNSVIPMLLGFFGLHGIMCSTEGLLLGQKDLNFLGKMYGAFFFIVPYLMGKVKKAALAGNTAANLASVWKIFLGYQVVRTSAFLARMLSLQRQTDKETKQEMTELAP